MAGGGAARLRGPSVLHPRLERKPNELELGFGIDVAPRRQEPHVREVVGEAHAASELADVFAVTRQPGDAHPALFLLEAQDPEPPRIPPGSDRGERVVPLDLHQPIRVDARTASRRENARELEQDRRRPGPRGLELLDRLLASAELGELFLHGGVLRDGLLDLLDLRADLAVLPLLRVELLDLHPVEHEEEDDLEEHSDEDGREPGLAALLALGAPLLGEQVDANHAARASRSLRMLSPSATDSSAAC